jgi:hypothetical protein
MYDTQMHCRDGSINGAKEDWWDNNFTWSYFGGKLHPFAMLLALNKEIYVIFKPTKK